jgi:hypothetical protein
MVNLGMVLPDPGDNEGVMPLLPSPAPSAGRNNKDGGGVRGMAIKEKDPTLDDYEKLKIEMIRDKIDEIIRTHPEDMVARLEELGLHYVEEDSDDEEIEEREARAENQRQRDLVAFFESRKALSVDIFEAFSEEKASENPNFPLLRRYFKKANQNLKALILYGLDNYHGRIDLLGDLAFFNEFENVLSILILHYTQACVEQENLNTFSRLARDFYYATSPDGYDAYYALRELFGPGSDKRKIIDFLIAEEETGDLMWEGGDRVCM